jgi:hypothetical protein
MYNEIDMRDAVIEDDVLTESTVNQVNSTVGSPTSSGNSRPKASSRAKGTRSPNYRYNQYGNLKAHALNSIVVRDYLRTELKERAETFPTIARQNIYGLQTV